MILEQKPKAINSGHHISLDGIHGKLFSDSFKIVDEVLSFVGRLRYIEESALICLDNQIQSIINSQFTVY